MIDKHSAGFVIDLFVMYNLPMQQESQNIGILWKFPFFFLFRLYTVR